MTYEGEIIEIKNPQEKLHSNEELSCLAEDISSSGKATGVKNNLAYFVLDKGGYMLFTFKDNTVFKESINTLFRYTLIFGGLAIAALFFLPDILQTESWRPWKKAMRNREGLSQMQDTN